MVNYRAKATNCTILFASYNFFTLITIVFEAIRHAA